MNNNKETVSYTSKTDDVTWHNNDEIPESALEESNSTSVNCTSPDYETESRSTKNKVKRTRRSIKPYSNDSLQIALSKCREGLSLRECSKRYGIPRSTLWDKLSGKASRNGSDISNSKFSVPISVENR